MPCQERRKPGKVQGRVLGVVALLASLTLAGGCKHCAHRPQWKNGECQYDRKFKSPNLAIPTAFNSALTRAPATRSPKTKNR